ncbi:iron-sulfur cluster repair protein YtfE [Roseovarius sp. ZX-A-9]|uniref:iron-sulfur cluster repair protein YtfE n=1 Tax=Roseovarius sp. ZX-A-9 TaxID=3014783 RepID=UPI00232F6E8B|nr:iron-sulfur cluster repair protein YtfE [Roseovarius sp. ZX-A-9]
MTSIPEPLLTQPVGQIAANLPGATGIFRKYDIDFCCHGDASLQQVADQRGLDVAPITDALAALDASAQPEVPHETDALIAHIQTRYHEAHRRQLPELVALSRKVEAVHSDHPEVPLGLAEILQQAIGEMEVHMKKEELILFPAMRRQGAGALDVPISQMRHDHDDHGTVLQQIDTLTRAQTPPGGACRSWQALYAGVAQFKTDLMEHIHLENNILFPRFEATSNA